MAKAGRLIISLGIDPSGLERGLRRVQRRIGGLSRQLNSAGRGLTAGLTAPLAAFGAMAIRSSVIFEDAFADVRKTVKGAGDDLSDSIRKMSKDLPLSATKIAGVVEELGRLGVQKENIIGAADAMVRLAETSTLSATDAATAIAKFANIMGTAEADIGRLASTLTVLGSEFPTTETDIINMATRLAGAGRIAGLAESDVLALSTALSSVGIRAEAGGTAISRVMQEIFTAVKDGGEKLDILADVAGMTAEEFRAAYEDKAVGAILAFIGGLGNLSDEGARVFEVLNDLDFGAIRVKTALLNSSLAVETATRALRRSSEEWAEFAALWELSEKRFETPGSQLRKLRNQLEDTIRTVGQGLTPAILEMVEAFRSGVLPLIVGAVKWFRDLDDSTRKMVISIAAIVAAIGPLLLVLSALVNVLRSLLAVSVLLVAHPLVALLTALGAVAVALGVYAFATRDAAESTRELGDNMDAVGGSAASATARLERLISTRKRLRQLAAEIKDLADFRRQVKENLARGVVPDLGQEAFGRFSGSEKQLEKLRKERDQLIGSIDGQNEAELRLQSIEEQSIAIQLRKHAALDAVEKKYAANHDELARLNGQLAAERRAFEDLARVLPKGDDLLQTHAETIAFLEGKVDGLNAARREEINLTGAESDILKELQRDLAIAGTKYAANADHLEHLNGQLAAEEKAFNALAVVVPHGSALLKEHANTIKNLRAQVEAVPAAVDQARGSFEMWMDEMRDVGGMFSDFAVSTIQQFTSGIGRAIGDAIIFAEDFGEAISNVFKNIAASIISSLIDIGIQMLIMQVITQTTNKVAALAVIGAKAAENYASMFASVVMALPFPANLIAPAVAAASTAKLIAGSLGLVALAEGGITTGPTLAMVGDNPGGREAIIPLNRLSDIFGDRGSAGTPVVIALDGRKVAEAIVPYIPAGVRRRIGGRI